MRLRARRPGVAALRSVVDRIAYVRPVDLARVSKLGRELPTEGADPVEPGPVGAEPVMSVGAEPVVPAVPVEARDGRSISGAAMAVTAVTGLEPSTSAVATLPHTVQ